LGDSGKRSGSSSTEIWKYGSEVEKILRQYDELRYRMLPYVYSAAWGITSRGEILMRALPFVYPNELPLRNINDQFLFGDSLLVNPVTEPKATTRKVVLPAGTDWVDFWTGRSYRGGQTIVADAPLDRMPILVKEGSIVPIGPAVQSTAETEEPLEIRVYAGRDADFQLYEDSGDGYAYEHGARATIHFHWDDHRNWLLIGDRSGAFPGMQMKRTFRIVVVRQGYGVGLGTDSGTDRSVEYSGHQMTVDLGRAG
jgi:alpha-D-xyloside xylohydrolase